MKNSYGARRIAALFDECDGRGDIDIYMLAMDCHLMIGRMLKSHHPGVSIKLAPDDLFKLGWSQEKMMDSGLFIPR